MDIVRPMTVNDAALLSSNVTEADFAAYNPATTYAAGDKVMVITTDYHHNFESRIGANTGNDPPTSPTQWLDLGATNRWAMHDGSVTSQTSNTTSIDNSYQISGLVDTLIALNVDGLSMQVTMTDPDEGVVYDETRSLVSNSGIVDVYAYCFEPIRRIRDIAFRNIPKYANAVLDVTISETGVPVKCGALIMGLSKYIGKTQWGASVGIQDYSIKQRDSFGNYTILERAFNKRGNFVIEVKNQLIDQLVDILSGFRATPIVYIASREYTSTMIYGFYKDFSVEITYNFDSICSMQLEGLT